MRPRTAVTIVLTILLASAISLRSRVRADANIRDLQPVGDASGVVQTSTTARPKR